MTKYLGSSPIRLAIALLLAVASPATAAQTPPDSGIPADTVRSATDTTRMLFPVIVGSDTLFSIAERIGPFPPEARVRAIQSRVETLVRDPRFAADSIRVFEGEMTSDLIVGDMVVMTVTDGDAAAIGLTRSEAAERYADLLETALRERSEEYAWRSIGLGAAFSVLATLVLVLILLGLKSGYPQLREAIRAYGARELRDVRIQNLELVPASRVVQGALFALRAALLVLIAALLYFYVPLVLSFFPWTRPLAATWLQYVLVPLAVVTGAIVGYLPNLAFLIVIALVTTYLLKVLHWLFDEVGKGTITLQGFYPEWAEPTYKIVRVLVIALAFIVAWPYLPSSDSTAFKGVAAFLGLLVSIGSATAVANMVGGVVMVYMRPFQIGDRVRIADTEGDVIEKTLLVTRVRTSKNVEVTIPNSMVLGSHIVNYSNSAREGRLILNTAVTIGYDVEWRRVHEALIEAALATEGIRPDPGPFVLQAALGDFAVSYELNAYTDEAKHMARMYSELHQNMQDQCAAADIEILSPAYTSFRDGNSSTIPGRAARGAGGGADQSPVPGS